MMGYIGTPSRQTCNSNQSFGGSQNWQRNSDGNPTYGTQQNAQAAFQSQLQYGGSSGGSYYNNILNNTLRPPHGADIATGVPAPTFTTPRINIGNL